MWMVKPKSLLRCGGLAATILVLWSSAVYAGIIEGRQAYRTNNFAVALKEFADAARGGSPVADYFVALMYLRGEGGVKDVRRGRELLVSSADAGYAAAQYLLARQYLYGHHGPKDRAAALSYLLAASSEDYRAVVLLKILEKESRGEKKDSDRITSEVRRRAKAGNPQAQHTLAFMHLIGDGVPKSISEEVRWYRAAAPRNHRAAFMLSLMNQYGEGMPAKPDEAFRLMRLAAELRDVRAQYYLGTFYYNGIGTSIDRRMAADWFRAAAEAGNADAQLAYGMLLLSGDGVTQDRGKALEWLSASARQNNVRAREIVKELLTYSAKPADSRLDEIRREAAASSDKRTQDGPLRLEGRGVILDEGTYGLKFSLPNLHDAYAPSNLNNSPTVWERLQGGTLDIVIRPSK